MFIKFSTTMTFSNWQTNWHLLSKQVHPPFLKDYVLLGWVVCCIVFFFLSVVLFFVQCCLCLLIVHCPLGFFLTFNSAYLIYHKKTYICRAIRRILWKLTNWGCLRPHVTIIQWYIVGESEESSNLLRLHPTHTFYSILLVSTWSITPLYWRELNSQTFSSGTDITLYCLLLMTQSNRHTFLSYSHTKCVI